MQHTDKAIAEFEAAYRSRYGSMPMMWSDSVAGYLSAHAAGAWWAWQASRAVLVIDLPERFDKYDSGDWTYWADGVDAAIEAAGVTVRG